jgi:hypothetical protein
MAVASLEKPGLPYSEIRGKLRTYDTILFRGSDLVSNAIAQVEKKLTGSGDFTHSGLVIRLRDLPRESWIREKYELTRASLAANDGVSTNDPADAVFVFESTGSGGLSDGVPAFTDNSSHLGVQLRDLDKVVVAYDSAPQARMAWLPLRVLDRDVVTDPWKLQAVLDKYLGMSYDASVIDLGAAAVPCLRCIRDNVVFKFVRDAIYTCFCCGAKPSEWLFCSELVAKVYVDIGAFPKTVNPQNVMPTDFLPETEGQPPAESEKKKKRKRSDGEDDTKDKPAAERAKELKEKEPASDEEDQRRAKKRARIEEPAWATIESLPFNASVGASAAAQPVPAQHQQKTLDADGEVPWVFETVCRFHFDQNRTLSDEGKKLEESAVVVESVVIVESTEKRVDPAIENVTQQL